MSVRGRGTHARAPGSPGACRPDAAAKGSACLPRCPRRVGHLQLGARTRLAHWERQVPTSLSGRPPRGLRGTTVLALPLPPPGWQLGDGWPELGEVHQTRCWTHPQTDLRSSGQGPRAAGLCQGLWRARRAAGPWGLAGGPGAGAGRGQPWELTLNGRRFHTRYDSGILPATHTFVPSHQLTRSPGQPPTGASAGSTLP